MRHIENLLGAASDTQCRRRTNIGELGLEVAVGIEHLHALVAFIGNVHVALCIDGDAVDDVELPLAGATRAPVFHPLAVLVVLGHAGVAIAVGHIDVALRVPRHVGGPVEGFTGRSRTGQRRWSSSTASASAATFTPSAAAASRRVGLNHRNAGRHRIEPRIRNRQRFRFAAEDHLHAAVRIELDHLR